MAGPFPFERGKRKRNDDILDSKVAGSAKLSPTSVQVWPTPVDMSSNTSQDLEHFSTEDSDPFVTESSSQLSSPTQSQTGGSVPVRHRGRGKAKGSKINELNELLGEKLPVHIHEQYRRPVDPLEARHLASSIGIAARENLPLARDYRKLSKEQRALAYERISSHVNLVGYGEKEYILGALDSDIAKRRRVARHKDKKRYESGDKSKPEHISQEDWEELTAMWESDKHKAMCERNRLARKGVKNMHNCGSISFVTRREQISREELGGAPCGEMLLFERTHFTRDPSGEPDPDSITGFKGRWVSEGAELSYHEMLRIRDEANAAGTPITEAEICNKVLKNDVRTDYLIGIGYGPKPSKGSLGQPSRVSKADLKKEVAELKAEMLVMWDRVKQEVAQEVQAQMEKHFQTMMMNLSPRQGPSGDTAEDPQRIKRQNRHRR